MINFLRFGGIILLFTVLLIVALHLSGVINTDEQKSAFIAVLLNGIYFAAAIITFNYAKDKSNQQFLLLFVGGMTIRMMFVLFAILLIFLLLNIDEASFIFVFFVLYIFFLVTEIVFYKKRNNGKLND